MASGLLSVLIPLFIVENLRGTLLDVGVITAGFNLATIPSVILWGMLSDKVDKRKIFIAASFLLTSITLVPLAFTKSILEFLILSVIQAFVFTMHEPATNMLMVELNKREKWDEKIGLYQTVSGVGWSVGLILGAVGVAVYNFSQLMLLSAGLYLATCIASIFLVHDPKVSFDREEISVKRARLGMTERARFHYRWIHRPPNFLGLLQKMACGMNSDLGLFNLGVFIFLLSATIVFTAFPIFFLTEVGLGPMLIFGIFFFNSLVSTVSYSWVGVMAERYGDKRFVQIASLSRIILFPLLIFCTILPSNGAILSAIILLGLIGLSWALFNVSSTTLSLQLVPKTKVGESSGIYYASTGLGSVLGSFLGGLLPFILWQSQQGIYIFFAAAGILFIFPLYIFSRLKVSATSQHSKL